MWTLRGQEDGWVLYEGDTRLAAFPAQDHPWLRKLVNAANEGLVAPPRNATIAVRTRTAQGSTFHVEVLVHSTCAIAVAAGHNPCGACDRVVMAALASHPP